MKVNKFDEYQKLQNNYLDSKHNITKIILDYINYNDKFRMTHIGTTDKIRAVTEFVVLGKIDGVDYYGIEYFGDYGKIFIRITQNELNDIVEFSDDPELYKSTKEYNI